MLREEFPGLGGHRRVVWAESGRGRIALQVWMISTNLALPDPGWDALLGVSLGRRRALCAQGTSFKATRLLTVRCEAEPFILEDPRRKFRFRCLS